MNDNPDISIKNSSLTSSQTSINDEIVFSRLGLLSNVHLSNRLNVVAGFIWSEGLTPTFETNDFKSHARKYNATVGLSYWFGR